MLRRFRLLNPRRSSRTAPASAGTAVRFHITHPFHPLRGREFESFSRGTVWSLERIRFHDDEGRVTSVPLTWTDLVEPDPFVVVAAGRTPFRVGDLLDLADLVAELSARKTRKGKDVHV